MLGIATRNKSNPWLADYQFIDLSQQGFLLTEDVICCTFCIPLMFFENLSLGLYHF